MSYNNYSEQDERDANAVAGRAIGFIVFFVGYMLIKVFMWVIGLW